MGSFSFRQYLVMCEERFDSVSDKVVDLARAVRDPESKEYIPDENVRELVIYCLEEIQRFVIRQLGQEKDSDESVLKVKQFRKQIYKSLKKIGEKTEHTLDLDKINNMIDKVMADVVKVVAG